MTAATSDAHPFGELDAWQGLLERHADLLEPLDVGARVGLVAREGAGILPGRRLEGLRASAEVPMLVWERGDLAMAARLERFAGMSTTRLDLLLVADDEALAAVRAALDGDALSAMKRALRRGNMMFFVFRTKAQLQDAGYEDFLDSLGLVFLGACR